MVQFKYGEMWCYEYHIGDELRWGIASLEHGDRNARRVVVDGAGDPCPRCGRDEDYEVFIADNRIDEVRRLSGRYVFFPETYIVLDGMDEERG